LAVVRKIGLALPIPHRFPVSSNVLMRDFDVAEPRIAWVTDITYVATLEGWLYLASRSKLGVYEVGADPCGVWRFTPRQHPARPPCQPIPHRSLVDAQRSGDIPIRASPLGQHLDRQ